MLVTRRRVFLQGPLDEGTVCVGMARCVVEHRQWVLEADLERCFSTPAEPHLVDQSSVRRRRGAHLFASPELSARAKRWRTPFLYHCLQQPLHALAGHEALLAQEHEPLICTPLNSLLLRLLR